MTDPIIVIPDGLDSEEQPSGSWDDGTYWDICVDTVTGQQVDSSYCGYSPAPVAMVAHNHHIPVNHNTHIDPIGTVAIMLSFAARYILG